MKNTLTLALHRSTPLLLAFTLFTGLTTGWFLSDAHSRNQQASMTRTTAVDQKIYLPTFTVNGETLPTINLKEHTVVAK